MRWRKKRPPAMSERQSEDSSTGGGRAPLKLRAVLWFIRRWLNSKEGREMLDKLKELGSGYRTYGVVAVLLLCVLAEKVLGWDVPGFTLTEDWLGVVLGAFGLGSLRAAVSRK